LANQNASASLTPGTAIPKMEDPGPLCAAHTPNFPALLRQLGGGGPSTRVAVADRTANTGAFYPVTVHFISSDPSANLADDYARLDGG
jgi:hypothetical protein